MLILGIIAFLLFVLGDINDAFFRKKYLKPCFILGLIMLSLATVCRMDISKARVVWFVLAAIFLSYLCKSLFGSFSVSEAYTDAPQEREVCDTGLYALCRHPGILFFAGLYICLHFGVSLPVADTAIYIVLNLALAALEDGIFFPKLLSGYDEYKMKVPFLIPTAESIKNSLKKTEN